MEHKLYFFQKVRKFVELIGWLCLAILATKGLISFWKETPTSNAQALTENSASVTASVPLYLDYEGYLTDMDGAPLTGYYTVTLRIYAGVADPIGYELWTEVHPNVPVRDGRFSVLLGNNTALPENIFDFPDRFIGATVAPFDELVPRQRLTSVPYAVHADHSASLNAPDGSPIDAVFVDNEGKVGIGTNTPSQKLDVIGNIFLDGNLGVGVQNPQVALDVYGSTHLDGTVNITNWASQNLAENGYAKIGSLLLQWGNFPGPLTQATYTVIFPISFTEVYNTQCLAINEPWNASQDTVCQAVTISSTNAVLGISWDGNGINQADGFYWSAIGR